MVGGTCAAGRAEAEGRGSVMLRGLAAGSYRCLPWWVEFLEETDAQRGLLPVRDVTDKEKIHWHGKRCNSA